MLTFNFPLTYAAIQEVDDICKKNLTVEEIRAIWMAYDCVYAVQLLRKEVAEYQKLLAEVAEKTPLSGFEALISMEMQMLRKAAKLEVVCYNLSNRLEQKYETLNAESSYLFSTVERIRMEKERAERNAREEEARKARKDAEEEARKARERAGSSGGYGGGYSGGRSSGYTTFNNKESVIIQVNSFLKKDGLPILPLSPSKEDVKRAHMALVKKNHPDVGGCTSVMQQINAAFDVIKA